MELSYIVLYCENVQASLTFYKQLGLTFKRERHGRGPIHYSTKIGSTVLELYSRKDKRERPSIIRLGILVNDPGYIVKNYINVFTSHARDAVRYGLLRDPDGNVIHVLPRKK